MPAAGPPEDSARPEPTSAEPAPPRPGRGRALLAVGAAVTLAVALTVLAGPWLGLTVLAAVLAVVAVARAMLPVSSTGWFAVRSRTVDTATAAAMAVALVALAMAVPEL